MIAYIPGRRRTARSVIRKWCLFLLAWGAIAGGITVSAVLAYDAIPEPEVIVIVPTPIPTATPYVPVGPSLSLPAIYPEPLDVPLGPRTADTVQPRVGPGALYGIVGALQAGAPVDVVGRDESGEWLAIVFPPNSVLRSWLPASHVLGVTDVEALPVEPVQPLP